MTESRAVPMHCPYCGAENLWPLADTHGGWECRACLRAFTVSLVGWTSRHRHSTAGSSRAANQ